MKVLLFGATGMVGQGVLRECLLDRSVTEVKAVGRTPVPAPQPPNAKFSQLLHKDLFDLGAVENQITGYDACFFCLGVSMVGLSEPEYRRLTYDLTLSVARTLARLNPQMTFVYVSGAGTDSTAKSSTLWARVKGETENALLTLPFRAAYMFRPGFIQPMHGITSKTKLYRSLYVVLAPLYPLLKRVAPKYVSTTEQVGRAMIEVAERGARQPIIENTDINALQR